MVTEQLWDDCCRRRVRPLHVEHRWRLERQRDHDLARQLQRRPPLFSVRLGRQARARRVEPLARGPHLEPLLGLERRQRRVLVPPYLGHDHELQRGH